MMRNIYRLGLLGITLLAFCMPVFAVAETPAVKQKKKPVVAVISDRAHRNGTTYLICGAASDIIASDIINALNQSRRIQSPLLGDTMSQITNNKLSVYKDTFFQEYKSNYNIDFVNLKRLTNSLNADYILMITSGLDIQSNFLKDTWWNKLNISGMDVVKPTYKLTTLLTLIDKKTYEIIWQDMYMKDISARNFDLGIVQFSPGYAQLSKIKKYSNRVAEHVVPIVDKKVNPELQPPEEPKAIELRNVHINEDKRLYYPYVHTDEVIKRVDKFGDSVNTKFNKHFKKKSKNTKNVDDSNDTKTPQVDNTEKKQDLNIHQINDIKPKNKAQEQKVVQPVIYKQPKDKIIQQKFIKHASAQTPKNQSETPSVNKIQTKPAEKPVKLDYPLKTPPKTVDPKPLREEQTEQKIQEQPKEQLPIYDWNLKNIYLKEIGTQTFYEKQANGI